MYFEQQLLAGAMNVLCIQGCGVLGMLACEGSINILLVLPGVSMGKDEGWAAAAPGQSTGGAEW